MNAAMRDTAHTLIDFWAGNTASDDEDTQRAAFETTLGRLNEVEAIVATQTDEGELTLDFTPLLLASSVTYHWLFDRLSAASGKSQEELTYDLRSFIDSLTDDES